LKQEAVPVGMQTSW